MTREKRVSFAPEFSRKKKKSQTIIRIGSAEATRFPFRPVTVVKDVISHTRIGRKVEKGAESK